MLLAETFTNVTPTPPAVVGAAVRDRTSERAMNVGNDSQPCDRTAWLIAVRDERDRQAFARLFEFFAPRLRTMLGRSGFTGAAADDIIQDVMLRVWNKAGQFDPSRASASAWLRPP
jgi:RNA polymerase sigma-70 factor (ECF subfamily)